MIFYSIDTIIYDMHFLFLQVWCVDLTRFSSDYDVLLTDWKPYV